MEKIKFHVDVKQTVWVREFHEVEFENKEALKEKLSEILMDKDFTIYDIDTKLNSFVEQSTDLETMGYMSVEENDGYSTVEIYFGEEAILQNGK